MNNIQETIERLTGISAVGQHNRDADPHALVEESISEDDDIFVFDHLPLLLRCLRACRAISEVADDEWDLACAALRDDHSGCETDPCGTCR